MIVTWAYIDVVDMVHSRRSIMEKKTLKLEIKKLEQKSAPRSRTVRAATNPVIGAS